MALAVLAAGALRAILPAQLRTADARWVLSLVLVILLATLIVGDPGRIDRDSTWLRVTTSTLIGVISLANAAAVIRLVAAITIGQAKFTNDANVLLASGGAVWLRYAGADWYPKFIDYLQLSFTTAMAFSPTDVSAIRPWAKLMLMAEDVISLLVALLVVARAVNILK